MELCVHSLIGMDLIQFNHFDVSLIFRRCASHSNNFTEYQRMIFSFLCFPITRKHVQDSSIMK